MKWSKYSILFESKRNGWLLFNTVSRSFMMVEESQLPAISGIMEDFDNFDFTDYPMLYIQLRSMGFIVEDTADDDYFNIAKMRNLTFLYGDSQLALTLAVTQACNFDCSYCFECDHKGQPMSKEVEEYLIAFVKSHSAKKINIVWYGGEPLMAFERILSINQRLRDIGKPYSSAMITNGYLLTEEKIAHLNELKINYLQITLDGSEETHDSRRYLLGGGKTYQTILENVGKVLASDFKGMVHIRVNVDSRNEDEFATVYNYIRNTYPKDFGKRITVYPGFVKGDDHPDCSCFFDAVQQGEFVSHMYEKYGITPMRLFPQRQQQGCVMTRRNAFVVGPKGELYKCWDDVGVKEREVGSLLNMKKMNMPLIAKGMVAASYLDDSECRDCMYFPICTGGCHRIRMDNLDNGTNHSSCTYFKGNLENLLEIYFEIKKKKVAAQKAEQAAKKAEAEAEAQADITATAPSGTNAAAQAKTKNE